MTTTLKNLSVHELVEETKRAVKLERSATLAVLERLREIYRRSVHLEMGYGSLHEFCVVELKFSDGAAHRRIQAMRLVEDLPVAKESLLSGSLTLSNAASLQGYFKKEQSLDQNRKLELLRGVECKSRVECEHILYPNAKNCEEINVRLDNETMADLKRLSELFGITQSDYATLIKKLAKIALKSVDPTLKPYKKTHQNVDAPNPSQNRQLRSEADSESNPAQRTRYISPRVKHLVFIRDNSQCTFISPITKRRCESRFRLHIDHRIPFAAGGENNADNLTLLCAAHNLHAAERVFGKEKMAKYKT